VAPKFNAFHPEKNTLFRARFKTKFDLAT